MELAKATHVIFGFVYDSVFVKYLLELAIESKDPLRHIYVYPLLLGQDEKPFSKSMLNRKMVFRVTKSKSKKDKISFIWCHMIILWWGGVWGVVWLDGGNMYSVFRRAE